MTKPEMQKYIKCAVSNARGDNLERAQAAFRGLTDEQFGWQYGASGRTCREVLEGYKRDRAEHDEAAAYLARLFEKDNAVKDAAKIKASVASAKPERL